MPAFANGATGLFVRTLLNGIITKVDFLTVTSSFDLDDASGVIDDVRDLGSFNPDDKVSWTALEIRVDTRTGLSKTATRISGTGITASTIVIWPPNVENDLYDLAEPNDIQPGTAPGALLTDFVSSAHSVVQANMGRLIWANSGTTAINLQTQATEGILRTTGHPVMFAIFNDTGSDLPLVAPAGVSINGAAAATVNLATGQAHLVIWTDPDTWRVQV